MSEKKAVCLPMSIEADALVALNSMPDLKDKSILHTVYGNHLSLQGLQAEKRF